MDGKVLPRNRDGRLITASKWNFLGIEFPDEDHSGSKKSPFCIGIHLTFFIRAPGRSSGRSRDHAGSHGMLFEQGIAAPNGLPKARDGGGGAHDFFHSGQLRPLGGAHFPLPRAANERGGRLVASRWRPTWKILSKTHSRWMGKVLPRKSTWEAYYCFKMEFLGNRVSR